MKMVFGISGLIETIAMFLPDMRKMVRVSKMFRDATLRAMRKRIIKRICPDLMSVSFEPDGGDYSHL
jgi:hypothetical protein